MPKKAKDDRGEEKVWSGGQQFAESPGIINRRKKRSLNSRKRRAMREESDWNCFFERRGDKAIKIQRGSQKEGGEKKGRR